MVSSIPEKAWKGLRIQICGAIKEGTDHKAYMMKKPNRSAELIIESTRKPHSQHPPRQPSRLPLRAVFPSWFLTQSYRITSYSRTIAPSKPLSRTYSITPPPARPTRVSSPGNLYGQAIPFLLIRGEDVLSLYDNHAMDLTNVLGIQNFNFSGTARSPWHCPSYSEGGTSTIWPPNPTQPNIYRGDPSSIGDPLINIAMENSSNGRQPI